MSLDKNSISFGLAFNHPASEVYPTKDNWKNNVTKIESLGFTGIFICDHFYPQWDPIASMGAISAVTSNINIGSIVFCNDYRHPVIHAKAAATLNLLSNNRHIFGIGAGWKKEEYIQAGIPFDKPKTRIKRMQEAIEIIKKMWTQEKTSFNGEYYQIKDIPQAVAELEYARPRLMIGGGGKMMLGIAGRLADIVSINFKTPNTEDWLHRIVLDGSYKRLGEKVETVRKAAVKAGRDPDELIHSQYFASSRMYGDPVEQKKKLANAYGASLDEINECSWIMADEPANVVESLKRRYEDYGITHYIIDGGDFPSMRDLEYFSEKVVKPLSNL